MVLRFTFASIFHFSLLWLRVLLSVCLPKNHIELTWVCIILLFGTGDGETGGSFIRLILFSPFVHTFANFIAGNASIHFSPTGLIETRNLCIHIWCSSSWATQRQCLLFACLKARIRCETNTAREVAGEEKCIFLIFLATFSSLSQKNSAVSCQLIPEFQPKICDEPHDLDTVIICSSFALIDSFSLSHYAFNWNINHITILNEISLSPKQEEGKKKIFLYYAHK